MSPTPHVAAVPGSLREESTTRATLRHALDGAEDAGASTDLLDLRTHDLPVFDADRRNAGDAPDLRRRVRAADAVVLGTPVYHHSYSAPLKNLLDYCGFDEFEETVVGVVAVAGGGCGGFPTEALGHLRGVALGLRAWVHPKQVTVPNASDNVAGGELVDPELAERVETLGAELARCGALDGAPEACVRA